MSEANFDFSNFQKLEVSSDKVVDYTIYEMQGEPVLQVSCCSESNKPYFNAILKRTKGNARKIKAAGITLSILNDYREEDRELFAKYVIKGWKKIKDVKGNLVPFSIKACLDLLKALPNHVFDNLRVFCNEPSNFIEDDEMTADEVDGLGKD